MFEDIETHKKLSKWIIGTFTACILIYLGIRHISHVADAVMWLKDLLNPLLIGLILALFLNVPLGVIERHLFPKHPTSRKTKMRRPLALLIMNQRQVYTYEMIMDSVWHDDFSFYSRNAISSHISNLRKKLKSSETASEHIKSIRGIGYKFEV